MKTLLSHWTFRVIILATVCAIVAALFNAARTPSLINTARAAQTPTVPPPPTQRAERFGIYNWNIDYTAYSESSNLDRLNWGAERVAEIGSRTIHAFLGTRDVYQILPSTTTDLVTIAKLPAYDKLFRDPRFKTIMPPPTRAPLWKTTGRTATRQRSTLPSAMKCSGWANTC